jgi:AraC-like DNA-binding protein
MEVARTVRVQRAKRLIDETDLPLSEIAFRAGFGSVRRFNAVFAEVYKRQPSEIRRGKRTSTPAGSKPKRFPTAKPITALHFSTASVEAGKAHPVGRRKSTLPS